MKKFEEFTQEDLNTLRNEISLNSLYISDYENSFGIKAESVCNFFDGYMDFIWELAEEDTKEKGLDPKALTLEYVFDNYDNIDTLWEWYWCFDDLSWIKYEENKDEY